jgi:hypothetical protein
MENPNGIVTTRPLLLKLTDLQRGESVLVDGIVYEVYRLDKYREYVQLTYHVNKNKRTTERMNLNYVLQKGYYVMFTDTGCRREYEIRIKPWEIKPLLYCLYNKTVLGAELQECVIGNISITVAHLRFNIDDI